MSFYFQHYVVFFIYLVRFAAVVTKVQKSALSYSFSSFIELQMYMCKSGFTISCDISHQYFAFLKHREVTHKKEHQKCTLLK